MDLKVHHEQDVCVVVVDGDIEAATADALRLELDGLLADGSRDFVIDLAGVPFIDSSGLGTLVHLFKRVRTNDGDVRICSLQDNVRRVFKLVRLDRVFDLYPSADAAVGSFAADG